MQPSVSIGYFDLFIPEKAVCLLREAGFAYTEFAVDHSRMLMKRSSDTEKTGLQFRSFLEEQGVQTPQGHLEFEHDLCSREAVEYLKKEITMFQAIGVKNAVFHISGGKQLPEAQRTELLLLRMRELLEFVAGTDFTFCLENLMSNPSTNDADGLMEWIRLLGGKNLGICLDTGHLHYARLGLKKTTQTHGEFIRKAGSYLKATHIQSNDGSADQHLAPYTGRANGIDWPGIVAALREIGYSELFNLELPGETGTYPPLPILKRKLVYLKDLADMMLEVPFSVQ